MLNQKALSTVLFMLSKYYEEAKYEQVDRCRREIRKTPGIRPKGRPAFRGPGKSIFK
jgi:hypothetical protein